MSGVKMLNQFNWDVDPIVKCTPSPVIDRDKLIGAVNFDIEILFPDIAVLTVPNVLLWPEEGDLTNNFYSDIEGYWPDSRLWIDYLKKRSFEFKREWLTDEILESAKVGVEE